MIDWGAIALKFGYNDPKKLVSDLYWKENKSLNEMCDELLVSYTTLRNFMLKEGIQLRPRSEQRIGPKCKNCGGFTSRIIAIRKKDDDCIIRERVCADCGNIFKTIEKLCDD